MGTAACLSRTLGLLTVVGLFLATPVLAVSDSSVSVPDAKQVEKLARGLHEKGAAAAYAQLSAFASRGNSGELGQRAALALGYYDYVKGRYAPARRWLDQAQGDPILREYALYWGALVLRAQRYNEKALAQLKSFRSNYPRSVMSEPALETYVETALALSQSELALDALAKDENTNTKPSLLMLRAQAQEQAGDREAAAADFLAVYYRYPLSPQARDAGRKILWLGRVMREKFPAVPLDQQAARAAALFDAHQWHEARQDYLKLLPALTNTDRERAELRIAECRAATGAGASALAAVTLNDPTLDAERLYQLAQIYRNEKKESPMLEAVDQAGARAPHSLPAEQALFLGGNYYWVQLDLDRAAQYYRRLVDGSPNGQDAPVAHWRIAWQAYRERRAEAASLLEDHLRRFSNSPYIGDVLYWLGRIAERDGNAPLARAYFGKLWDRYPQTYFGGRAAERLKALGPGPRATAEVLDFVPPPPPARSVDEDTPPAAEARVERARALHSVGFDATEELEYRAAYAETNVPGLLLDAAQAAAEAHHYSVAFVTVRQIVPQLESHPIHDVPRDVWRAAYPLPYQPELERLAPQAGVDPMQVAGLVRQESGFERDAVSRAGAIGLMQLLPKTAKKLARRLKLRYARDRLFDPDYNLRLGTVYFADLRNRLGSTEGALAAYNAGDDRVVGWQAGRNFEEPAEFVESIPFTETRDYVQIVMRNSAIYQALYGGSQ